MKPEELFLAIGQVESSRLARTELTMQSPSARKTEEPDMKKHANPKRIIRNLFVAAIIVSMLGVTAYAVGGFLIFDSPSEMIQTIFGDETGYDHKDITTWTDSEKPGSVYENPAYDRVPVDETVMEEDIVPYVSAVGQSISWEGYTLTVDGLMYDSTTGCGILTYKLENPEGVGGYTVENNGEVWGHIVDINQYGYSYIIQEKSTDTCLAATYYFKYDASDVREQGNMEVTFSQWTKVTPGAEYHQHTLEVLEKIKQEYTPEQAVEAYIAEHGQEEYDRLSKENTPEQMAEYGYGVLWNDRLEEMYACPYRIHVDVNEESFLKCITLGEGTTTISPICFQIDVETLEFLHTNSLGDYRIDGGNVRSVVIRYHDGTEYTVIDEGVENVLFKLSEYPDDDVAKQVKVDYGYVMEHTKNCSVLTLMFNRIIDVDKVQSVLVNGVELTLD